MADFTFVAHKRHAPKYHMENKSFYTDRIGFWANVTSVNSQMNTINVRSDQGIEYKGIRVASREWMNNAEQNSFISGSRNLPKVGAFVFILMPERTVDSAFALCSGFARGESNTGDFYAADSKEQDEKDSKSELITQGGWKKEENYQNGNIDIKSLDGTVQIHVVNKDEGSVKKSIALSAWNNEITVNADGIEITDANKNKITANKDGVVIKNPASGKIEVGNATSTIGKLLDDIVTQLIGLKTVGSPAAHTASPDFISKMTEIKTTLNLVLK